MNKILFISYFLSSQIYCAPVDTVIVLKVINHRGRVMNLDVAIASSPANGPGTFLVNREKLTSTEIIIGATHITNLASFSKEKENQECSSGQFIHQLLQGSVKKSESGCINSERFKSLKESFKALGKDRVIAHEQSR